MRFADLFRRRVPVPEPASWSGPPDATPIHAWLDAAGFPWRATRDELAARFGVAPDPAYGWDAIAVPTDPPILDGLIRPLSAQAFPFVSTRQPAVRFSGALRFGEDARENVRRAAAQLEPHLGGTRVGPEHNVFQAEWRFGPTELRLIAWPLDLQQGAAYRNEAHERDPRLATACHIHIGTGYRAPLSAVERGWLETFTPLVRLDVPRAVTPAVIRDTVPPEAVLEYVRRLPDDQAQLIGQLGTSAGAEALVFCTSQLFVVPMSEVVGLRLEQTRPAKGAGGEWLHVACHAPDEPDSKTIGLASGAYDGRLEAFGRDLAARLGRPFEIVDLGYDA